MSTRATYDRQIKDLADVVVTMASMVDKAIARATEALRVQNVELARSVRKADKEINAMQRQGEDKVLSLIALQAPMASDLRRITSTLAIVSNLERIGDYASGVARIVIDTADQELIKPIVDIPRMSELARGMLGDVITAFVEHDADLAREIAARDDMVDDLYAQVFRELLTYMMADTSTINQATQLLWAAHNVERIADRVTNICERIVFSVTGEFEELDDDSKARQRDKRAGSSDNGVSG